MGTSRATISTSNAPEVGRNRVLCSPAREVSVSTTTQTGVVPPGCRPAGRLASPLRSACRWASPSVSTSRSAFPLASPCRWRLRRRRRSVSVGVSVGVDVSVTVAVGVAVGGMSVTTASRHPAPGSMSTGLQLAIWNASASAMRTRNSVRSLDPDPVIVKGTVATTTSPDGPGPATEQVMKASPVAGLPSALGSAFREVAGRRQHAAVETGK